VDDDRGDARELGIGERDRLAGPTEIIDEVDPTLGRRREDGSRATRDRADRRKG
jgi:hypothetical protein